MAATGMSCLLLTTPLAAFLGFLGLFFILSHIRCGAREEQSIIQKWEASLEQCRF